MKRVVLATLAILAVATTAWAQDIRYNFDKSANFAKYKTYKWVENKSGDKLDDLTKKDLESAIEAELAKKGLTKSPTDSADLYLAYTASVSTEKQVNTWDTGYGAGPGYYGPYGYGGWSGGSRTVDLVHDLQRHRRGGHVRRLDEAARVARRGVQGTRRQGKAGQATKEHREGVREAVQELSPTPTKGQEVDHQRVAWPAPYRRCRSAFHSDRIAV